LARAVYSQPFLQYGSGGGSLDYEVPEGFIAVIRQFSVYNDIGGNDVSLGIRDSPEAPYCFITGVVDFGVGNFYSEEGRWVVPGGGEIQAFVESLGTSTSVYVGGYLLVDD
jgi:hypothetical protein